MSAGELKGVYASSNLPAQLKDYIERSVQSVFDLNTKLKNSAKYRVVYQQMMFQSLADVRRTVTRNAQQFRDAEWNANNQKIYTDALGVAYRKDGTILVVVTNAYEARSVGPAGNIRIGKATPSSPAEFDSTFNRVVITPVFAELLRLGRVRTLGQDGKYHSYSLDDVIHHEWGHSGDLGYDERTLGNKKYDNGAEIVERLGQLIDGEPVRADHGGIQYQALDGSWVSWLT